MASFRKQVGRTKTTYLARVRVAGSGSETKTFPTLAEAKAWARTIEGEMASCKRGGLPDLTVGDMIRRYIDEVAPNKDGGDKERMRLERLFGRKTARRPTAIAARDRLVDIRLRDFASRHVAEWKARRLQSVSEASVNREWSTLSKCCTIAVRNWQWLHINPFRIAERPADPPARKRRPTSDEIERLKLTAGYTSEGPLTRGAAEAIAAFLLAVETAARVGELCLVKHDDIDWERSVMAVTASQKGGRKGGRGKSREVPLSNVALGILRQFRGRDETYALGISPINIEANWRRLCKRALVNDLHFHDSRREALTRLAKRFEVLELAKISGHTNLRELLETYYAPDAAEFVARLNAPPPAATAPRPNRPYALRVVRSDDDR